MLNTFSSQCFKNKKGKRNRKKEKKIFLEVDYTQESLLYFCQILERESSQPILLDCKASVISISHLILTITLCDRYDHYPVLQMRKLRYREVM